MTDWSESPRKSPINPPKEVREEASGRRFRSIRKGMISGAASKGFSMFAAIISIPLTIHCFGPELYGLWIGISSTVNLILWFDIGIANALTNLISEAFAKEDCKLAGDYFASAFWMSCAVAAGFGLIAYLAWPHLHWNTLFHLNDAATAKETSRGMAAALCIVLLSIPSGLGAKLLGGYQEVHIANAFSTVGSAGSLVAILVVTRTHGTLFELIVGYAGAPVAANLVCLFWLLSWGKPWLQPSPTRIRLRFIRTIFGSGSKFFLLQIAGLLACNCDSLVITHYLGPKFVTSYSIVFRMTSFVTAIQSLLVPSLWPAYAEAFHRGDLEWVKATYRRVRLATAAMLVLACVLFLGFGKRIVGLVTDSTVTLDPWLLRWMCVWMIILAVTINQTCLMGAVSRISKQAILTSIASIANLGLSILWVQEFGVVGVILSTIVTFFIFNISFQTWEVRGILNGKSWPLLFSSKEPEGMAVL